jgi:hypothetical protein
MNMADKLAAILSGDIEAILKLGPVAKIAGDTGRCAIGSEPGKHLIGADLIAIEACVGAWVAGDEVELERWRRFLADRTNIELDPYRIEGLNAGFPEDIARPRGKILSLAFQYMGGTAAFRNLAPSDFVISDDEIQTLKWDWRRRHNKHKDCWDALDAAAVAAVSGGPGTAIPCGKVVFRCERLCGGKFLYIDLPSCRSIAYPFARIIKNKFGEPAVTFKDNARGQWLNYRTKSKKKGKPAAEDEGGEDDDGNGEDTRDEEEQTGGAYGGTWFENIVSGIARDLLADAMLRVEEHGYPVVLHVHDELVSEVPDGFGSLEEYVRLVEQLPVWAQGIPVGAKGRNGPRFAEVELPIGHVPGGFIDMPLPAKPQPKGKTARKPKADNGASGSKAQTRKSRKKSVASKLEVHVAAVAGQMGLPLAAEPAIDAPTVAPEQDPIPLRPDRAMAERFLDFLDPTAIGFSFQTADDNRDRRNALPKGGKDPFARKFHCSLAQCWDALCRLNAAGAAIYVTICETDLQGRETGNVERARLVFADLDEHPRPAGAPPVSMVVETSQGCEALYWRPATSSLAAFTATQKAIANLCGSDRVHDVTRVMRLPGFLHNKIENGKSKGPFLSRIIEINENAPTVTADDFQAPTAAGNETAAYGQQAQTDARVGSITIPKGLLDGFAAAGAHDFPEGEPSPWRALNALALANLKVWVPELFGDIATFQPGTGGYRIRGADMGEDLARALGRDPEGTYQEDLSLHPTKGIKDFGTATDEDNRDTGKGRYSSLDLVMAVLGLDLDGAFAWLDERLCGTREGADSTESADPGNGPNPTETGSGPAEPKPTPKGDDWPVLDPMALHGLAGEYVRTVAPHTEAPAIGLLMHFLTFFGNAVGRTAWVFGDGRHYPVIYTMLAGRTSKGRKGTAELQARHPFEVADAIWELNNFNSTISSGEGILDQIRDAGEPKRDKRTGQMIVEDQGVADKRLMLCVREFASAFDNMQRPGNTASATIRDLWDSPRVIKPATKHSKIKVTGAHVSIMAHMTINELRSKLDSNSATNGFGNRFLYACSKRENIRSRGGKFNAETTAKLGKIARDLKEALAMAKQREEMFRTAAADETWDALYMQLTVDQPGLFGDLTARSEPQVLRLALIYALLDQSEAIECCHLKAADALWRYCEDSARHIFGDSLGNPFADDVLRLLKQAGSRGLSRREIYAAFGNNPNKAKLSTALTLLATCGRAKCIEKPGTGFGASAMIERWFAT